LDTGKVSIVDAQNLQESEVYLFVDGFTYFALAWLLIH